MLYQFKNRYSGRVQAKVRINAAHLPASMRARLAVIVAVAEGVDLHDADLSKINLSQTNLIGIDLKGASLYKTNLYNTDLRRANLGGTRLGGTNLQGTNVTGANFDNTNLHHARLEGAKGLDNWIIDGGLRSDGYRFFLTRTDQGPPRVKAGCRDFTLPEAWEHWINSRHNTPLGTETFAILDHLERVARTREWPITNR